MIVVVFVIVVVVVVDVVIVSVASTVSQTSRLLLFTLCIQVYQEWKSNPCANDHSTKTHFPYKLLIRGEWC